MAKSTIKAGVCGFTTVVQADSDEMQNVAFTIETDCDKIKKMADGLTSVDAYSELAMGYDGEIFARAKDKSNGVCSGCVVANGVFKAMQVAAGLSLAAPVSIDIES